jgi:hypothetical protein
MTGQTIALEPRLWKSGDDLGWRPRDCSNSVA